MVEQYTEELYEIGCSPDNTYVYARAFNIPYTAELALTVAEKLVGLGKKSDVLGCVIDIRGTWSVSSILDKYIFAYKKASFVGLPRHWKLAFIMDHDSNDSPEFIEIVMRNAAYMFKIFEDECKAVDWIKGEKNRY